jgi:F420-non-reducing hydrogenase large subunit
MIEMAFRAYDPCHGCATHSLPGSMPLAVRILDRTGQVRDTITRGADGMVTRS